MMINNTKLMVCTNCDDIVSLRTMPRTCACGKSRGYLMSEGRAEVYGIYAVPIGFVNHSFINAVKFRPSRGLGMQFQAFVFPQVSDTIKESKS